VPFITRILDPIVDLGVDRDGGFANLASALDLIGLATIRRIGSAILRCRRPQLPLLQQHQSFISTLFSLSRLILTKCGKNNPHCRQYLVYAA